MFDFFDANVSANGIYRDRNIVRPGPEQDPYSYPVPALANRWFYTGRSYYGTINHTVKRIDDLMSANKHLNVDEIITDRLQTTV